MLDEVQACQLLKLFSYGKEYKVMLLSKTGSELLAYWKQCNLLPIPGAVQSSQGWLPKPQGGRNNLVMTEVYFWGMLWHISR